MYDVRLIQRDRIAIVYVRKPPDVPGLAYKMFSYLAQQCVNVDIILQTASHERTSPIIFTVDRQDAERTHAALTAFFSGYPDTSVDIDTESEKISVSGDGMKGKPGIAAKVLECLWNAGVKIINISTSEIKISMLTPARDAERAYNALVRCFML